MSKPRLVVAFSGGETSGFLAQWLRNWRDRYEIVFLFNNTGEENEETLEFVQRCDEHFDLGVVWVEAVTRHNQRAAPGARVVDFKTASRQGEPFEAMIQKHGVPNTKFPHCTRELKTRPMMAYLEDIGWPRRSYQVAVGIRADEAHRRRHSKEQQTIYPLIDMHPMTKPDINAFWDEQPFRLELYGYQGNCKWCWKKSMRKLMLIMDERPEHFEFPARMERDYGLVGPEFTRHADKLAPDYRRTFFRGSLGVDDLRARLAAGADKFNWMEDDSLILPDGSTIQMDDDDGCVESCEVDFDDA